MKWKNVPVFKEIEMNERLHEISDDAYGDVYVMIEAFRAICDLQKLMRKKAPLDPRLADVIAMRKKLGQLIREQYEPPY